MARVERVARRKRRGEGEGRVKDGDEIVNLVLHPVRKAKMKKTAKEREMKAGAYPIWHVDCQ